MPNLLAQLKAAAEAQEKATPEPWKRGEISMPGYALLQRGPDSFRRSSQLDAVDVDFIVQARSLPLAALARLVEAASAVLRENDSGTPAKLARAEWDEFRASLSPFLED